MTLARLLWSTNLEGHAMRHSYVKRFALSDC
jgi:hypothetical protein